VSVYALDPLRDARHRDARAARECADWLAHLELEGKATRTLDDYERTVAVLLRTFEDVEMKDISDGDLAHLLRRWPEGSRRIRRAHLNSFFTWAYRMGRIERNPMERVPRPRPRGQTVVDCFTDAEIELLRAESALLSLMLDTGIRKSECRNLQRRHISLERAQLVVYQGKGGKDRAIPMNRVALAAVVELDMPPLSPDDFLWYSKPGGGNIVDRSRAIGNGTFHRWYGRCLEAAGVAYRNPHTTRHTFATRFLRRGGRLENLSLVMGHASIRTTFDLYGHLDLEDARADLALLEA
jgi:integrase